MENDVFTNCFSHLLPRHLHPRGSRLRARGHAKFTRGCGGVIDVTTRGVLPNDNLDDSKLIQQICDAAPSHAVIYLPPGTYVFTNPVSVGDWKDLCGAGRGRTIIKLQDNCPGYNDANNSKVVFGHKPLSSGFCNMCFDISIGHLTVNTGSGNPGAIGVYTLSNNGGGVTNVEIVSGDGKGVVGMDMRHSGQGPALYKNISITGFDYGIFLDGGLFNSVLWNITVKQQKVAGIAIGDHPVQIENLSSINSVPAIDIRNSKAMLQLVNATLAGGRSDTVAINNPQNASLYLRNIHAGGGYRGAATAPRDTLVSEYVTPPVLMQFPSPKKSLNLPVKQPPFPPRDPVTSWTMATTLAATQTAIDNGASTIYFPSGSLSGTLTIRNKVKWLMGLRHQFNGNLNFRIESTSSDAVVVERFYSVNITYASPKPLIVEMCNHGALSTESGSGDLFLNNFCCHDLNFNYPQNVWIRQYNSESGTRKLVNNAAKLYILGYKTEGQASDLLNGASAFTEIIGGLLYPGGYPSYPTNVVNNGGHFSITTSLSGTGPNFVEDTWKGVTKTLANPGKVNLYISNPDSQSSGSAILPRMKPTLAAGAPIRIRQAGTLLRIQNASTETGIIVVMTSDGRRLASQIARAGETVSFAWPKASGPLLIDFLGDTRHRAVQLVTNPN